MRIIGCILPDDTVFHPSPAAPENRRIATKETPMSEKDARRPIAHFFLKRSVQFAVAGRIVLVMLLTSALTTFFLALSYHSRSRGGSLYYMSHDLMQDLELQSMLELVLPALITAQVISLFLGAAIGLFSSRKIGVILYKIERWAVQLKTGRLNTHLDFREKEKREFKDIVVQCNAVTDTYRDALRQIDDAVERIARHPHEAEGVASETDRLRSILQRFDFR
jgi:methyl-accepting chemotaxis protein